METSHHAAACSTAGEHVTEPEQHPLVLVKRVRVRLWVEELDVLILWDHVLITWWGPGGNENTKHTCSEIRFPPSLLHDDSSPHGLLRQCCRMKCEATHSRSPSELTACHLSSWHLKSCDLITCDLMPGPHLGCPSPARSSAATPACQRTWRRRAQTPAAARPPAAAAQPGSTSPGTCAGVCIMGSSDWHGAPCTHSIARL